jgi:phosphatidylglycerophosphatase A
MDKTLRQKVNLGNPLHLLALGFGSGLSPKMPGTIGSLAAIPFVIPLLFMPVWMQLCYVCLSFMVGVMVCDRTANDMGIKDHGSIVWDEFVGMMCTFLALPYIDSFWQLVHVFIVGFVLFRAFDIVKPWPISWIDKKVQGGMGIMLDDVLAGVAAWGMLQLWMSVQF